MFLQEIYLDSKIVGEAIAHCRKSKKVSQEVLSGLADIGRTHLSAIERGERKPTLETFFKIAEALNIRPSVLLAEIEEELNK
jgi:transcriptional regulator with XRE-family HTH domain